MDTNKVHIADAETGLKTLPDRCVQMCVTSPPYFGLRDYGHNGQIGLEETPEAYVARIVGVFSQVRRVLKDDGILWINIGDSYNSGESGSPSGSTITGGQKNQLHSSRNGRKHISSLKHKDLIGIPWMVAFALRADGWYLRQDIIWHKPNPMPESVTDRCTKAHEYIFLLSKSERYYYDAEAIKEDAVWDVDGNGTIKRKERQREGLKSNPDEIKNGIRITYPNGKHKDGQQSPKVINGKRNKRSVWTVNTEPYPEAHFAVYPPDLIVPCIKAGSRVGDIVLDPFMGSGTTAEVAMRLERKYIGFEINAANLPLIEKRTKALKHNLFSIEQETTKTEQAKLFAE